MQIALDKGDIEFGVGTPAFQFPLFAKGQLPPIVNYYEYTYPYKWDVAVKPESGIQKLRGPQGQEDRRVRSRHHRLSGDARRAAEPRHRSRQGRDLGRGRRRRLRPASRSQRGVIDALAYFDTGFGQIDAAGIAMRMLPRPPDVPLIGGLFISATREFPQGQPQDSQSALPAR